MSSCNDVTPLVGGSIDSGLFDEVGDLAAGRVRLRLQGRYQCRDVDRPFYRFEILDAHDDAVVGEISFMPERDTSVVGALGHSGGGLTAGARGSGMYGEALRALAPLAQRHGLDEFLVAIPDDNHAGRRAVEKLELRHVDDGDGYSRFAVPT